MDFKVTAILEELTAYYNIALANLTHIKNFWHYRVITQIYLTIILTQ